MEISCWLLHISMKYYKGKSAKDGNTLNSNLDHNKKCINFSKCMRTVYRVPCTVYTKRWNWFSFCVCSSAIANGTIIYSLCWVVVLLTMGNTCCSRDFQIIRWNGYVNGTLSIEITTLKNRHKIKDIALGKTFNVFSFESLSIAFSVFLSSSSLFLRFAIDCVPIVPDESPPRLASKRNRKLEQIETGSINSGFSIAVC